MKKRLFGRAFVAAVLCAAGFGFMAFAVGGPHMANIDRVVTAYIRGMQSDSLTTFMKAVTWVGSGQAAGVITIVAMAFLYKRLGFRTELVLLAAVGLGSWLLNVSLKAIFRRTRPEEAEWLVDVYGYSFPSGHSMGALALYGILAYLLWKRMPGRAWRGALLLLGASIIAAIGVSRIYLGVHYPSDVVGGYLASACWASAFIMGYEAYRRRRERR
ncbi:phosphatase PAP2 family protein [Paenibacillus flagellatus]|uniref:Phosphatidic acid phosphatase type 2/haloperoxidase domain-containing protein n=1 Tax=Paenibacillus flagellatus TaxID=2211139 RepID=A0A2V5K7R4_9BACL|nr:phosphatase PAP2 family protein [Paenibacillus flagellatus]PYI55495.1 hypothetical protein DLM86_07105 [Paenibacillus flagellatus]